MSRLSNSTTRVAPWSGSAYRQIRTVLLCLVLFVGLGGAVASDPPPSKKKGAQSTRKSGSRSGRPKPRSGSTPRPKRKPARSRPKAKTATPPEQNPGGSVEAQEAEAGSDELSVEADLDAVRAQMRLPAEERRYSFSFDGTYANLLDAFSRMSGLAILGDTPSGAVSYSSTEEMSYEQALSRLRKILFNHPDKYYTWRDGPSLEIFRMTEAKRRMPLNRIYTNVDDFVDAGLDEMEVVLVLYSPPFPAEELEVIRDFMPDYVLIAPYPGKNAVTILALTADVNKYMSLIDRVFGQDVDDPRAEKFLTVEHILPSEAVGMLMRLVPGLTGDGAATPAPASKRRKKQRRTAPQALTGLKGLSIDLEPIDHRSLLWVRAMPYKIEEIEEWLAIIDAKSGPSGDPIIISPVYVRVEVLLANLRPMYPGMTTAAGKKSKGKGGRAPSLAVIATEGLEVYSNSLNNTLIVRANEEELTKLRMNISLFDVPSTSSTVRIPVEHGDVEVLMALVMQIAQNLDPIGSASMVLNVDPANNGLIVTADPKTVDLIRSIAADLDQPSVGGEATVHIYKCRNGIPSGLINLLTSLDRESASAPSAAGKKGKKGKRPARKRSAGGTRYHGDDAAGTLYVICNADEWEEHYLPLLKTLDEAVEKQVTILELQNIDPNDMIVQLNQAFSADKGAIRPKLMPHPDGGIVVTGASESQLEYFRRLISEFDVDPNIERRTFKLKYAQPAELKVLLESLVTSRPVGRVTPVSKGKGKRQRPVPTGGEGDVQIIENGRSELIVVAPSETMSEIAELIAEYDVDSLEMTARVYDLEPGVDAAELAQTLSSFYPGVAAVQAKRGKDGKQRGRAIAQDGSIRFIPQVAQRKLLVWAPADMFEDIEEKLALLRPAGSVQGPEFKFYAVEYLEPGVIAGHLEMLLDIKFWELVDKGELGAPESPGKGKPPVSPVTVTPDPRGDRVIVITPPQLVEFIPPLLEELDRPEPERIVRKIDVKAEPADMVSTIRTMWASRATAVSAAPKGGKGGKRPPAARGKPGESPELTIVAAPGGSAVVLRGYPDAVAEAEEWITDLDEGGREQKVYAPINIDVDEFADAVMALIDSGGGPKGKAKAKAKDDSLLGGWFEPSGGPRRGKDIWMYVDSWGGTAVVSATPAKLREIDELLLIYDGDPELGIEPVKPRQEVLPYSTYTLKHRDDAYNAVYDLEMILDALWHDPENKPKVDYIPFTSIMTIRGRPDDFDKVIALVEEYVDKPGERQVEETGQKIIPVTGMTPEELALVLQTRLGRDMVEIKGLSTPDKVNYGIEEVTPCVLPVSAARMMAALAMGNDEETGEEPPDPSSNTDRFDDDVKHKLDVLHSIMGEAEGADDTESRAGDSAVTTPTTPPGADAANPDADTVETALTAYYDNEKGILVITGGKQQVSDAGWIIEKILKDKTDVPQPPDIRVFRLKYVDVTSAAGVLEAMFNAQRQRTTAAQRQQQRQRQAQQKAKQQAQQGQQAQGQDGNKDRRRPQDQQEPQVAQQTAGQIRVFPDARTRTIIVRAAPEQYPSIIKLLATIDKKGTAADFRVYPLKRLNAAEVEATLKEMLGIGATVRRTQARRTPQRGQQRRAQQQQQQQVELEGLGGESIKGAVTISSSPAANTIMAMAPEKTLDLIGEFIEELENQEAPKLVDKTYPLTHADAAEVVTYLEKLYSGKKRAGTKTATGFDPGRVNSPTFIADTRTNSVIVRALDLDHPKVEPMILRLDQVGGDVNKPHYITLQYAKPTEIARKLQEAFAARGGGKRGSRRQVVVTGDDGSMQLIVTAPADVLADIREMVSKIDIERTNLDFKFYPLEHARAPEVLQQMTQLIKVLIQQGGKQDIDLGVFSAVADEKTNALIVAGEPTIFPIVESMLTKIDKPEAGPVAMETRVYALVSAQAQEVANTVNRLFGKRVSRGVQPPQAEANPTTNTVLVRATKKEQDEIWEQVIKPLDEFAEGQAQEIYQLQHARASEVANTVNQALRGRKRGQVAVTVVANDPLNQLIVIGNGKDVEEVLPLIAKLDLEPLETSELIIEVYEVKYVDPSSLIGAINNIFRQVRGSRPEDVVRASYAWGTASLVISASKENHEKVAKVIAEMDVESAVERTRHVIKLRSADAGELARQLTSLYQRTKRRRRDDMGVTIAAEPATNSLLVYGNDKELADIQGLIETLDVAPEEQRQIRSFKLNYAECWELREAVTKLVSGAGGRRVGPRDRVDAYPNWASNTLIVAASPENMVRIEAFIEEVDQPGQGDRQVTVIEVENADAASVSRSLNDIFVRSTRTRRGQQTISIANPQGSNTLMIRANEEELAEIQAVIDQIEVAGTGAGGDLKIVALEFTDPEEMSTILEEYLRKPGGRGGRGRGGSADLIGDVRISISSANQALILSGAAEQLEEIAAVVAQIDVEMEGGGNVPRIIHLEHAVASEIQPQLEELFKQQSRGRSRSRSGSSMIQPVIVASDATNSLIVRAGAADFSAIERLVEQLDSEEFAGEDIRIVTVAPGINVEDMATMIEESFNASTRGGGSRGRGRQAQQLMITPDRRTNSLLLAGAPGLFDKVEATIRQMEKMSPKGGRVTRIYTLEHLQGSDVEAVIKDLTEDSMGSKRPSRGRSSRGRSGRRR
ncbi:MAG: hypothetical protein GY842_07305 [bacterium]|nr:hypothetical protein [bacterium]